MPDEDGDDDDSPAESEWGAPAAGDDESDVESARGNSKESKDNGKTKWCLWYGLTHFYRNSSAAAAAL